MAVEAGAEAQEPAPFAGPALRVAGLSHSFGDLEVLEAIDLEVGQAEVVALVGPSGCGKSTLLELAAGLAEPAAGTIEVAGLAAAPDRLSSSAYMPQQDLLLPWLRAVDNAALGLRAGGAGKRSARRDAEPLFERLGLSGFERSWPEELSGGMRQRVAFARTLLTGEPLLLLDEPFAALDAITRGDLQSWLRTVLAAEPRAVLLVTHDVEEALFVADRVIVLSPRPGRAVWEGAAPHAEARTRGAEIDRAAAVTDPAFTAVREQALHALGEAAAAAAIAEAE